MGIHHKLTLYVREEPEGHGVLFAQGDENNHRPMLALALVPRDRMEDREDSSAYTYIEQLLNTHMSTIANGLMENMIQGPFPNPRQQKNEAQDAEQAHCNREILRFVSWLGGKYEIWPKDASTKKTELQDLVNEYFGDDEEQLNATSDDTALVALALKEFIHWLQGQYDTGKTKLDYTFAMNEYFKVRDMPELEIYEVVYAEKCPFKNVTEQGPMDNVPRCHIRGTERSGDTRCVGPDDKDCPLKSKYLLLRAREEPQDKEPVF